MGVRRVLLVDDNADLRYLTKLAIQSDSCEIVGEASNGVEAIKAAEELAPDVVVIDLCMPMMDGVEATKILRERFPDLRIIAMTGSDDPVRSREIDAAGADFAIDKTRVDELLLHLDA